MRARFLGGHNVSGIRPNKDAAPIEVGQECDLPPATIATLRARGYLFEQVDEELPAPGEHRRRAARPAQPQQAEPQQAQPQAQPQPQQAQQRPQAQQQAQAEKPEKQ